MNDDLVTAEEMYTRAIACADAITDMDVHPMVLLAATQMVAASVVGTIESMADQTDADPLTRAEATKLYREIVLLGSEGGLDDLRILSAVFSLPDQDAGRSAALLAIRAAIAAEQNYTEAIARLVAAATVIKTAFSDSINHSTLRERTYAVTTAAHEYLEEEQLPIVNAAGGDA